jgi:RimK family alpha-L-glutamate ligase
VAQEILRMRFLVLASPDSWYLRDLMRAAAGRHEIVPAAFSEMAVRLTADGLDLFTGEYRLGDFDAVIVRTMPPGSLEQVVFRMDCLGRYEAAGGTVVNPARAIEAAVDKFLTSAKLQAAGINTPRTYVCQTPEQAMMAFEELGGNVVVKPLFGSEGRGITRLNDEALALRAFKMLAQLGAVLYVQEFIEHEGFDLRLMLIGERVLSMRRRNPLDWRTNVSRGATTESFEPTTEMLQMARQAAEAVGAPLAGVDLLPRRDGTLFCIEVNAVPGWKALARTHDVDVAKMVLDFVTDQVRRNRVGQAPRA